MADRITPILSSVGDRLKNFNKCNKQDKHNTRILCECLPLEEGQEDGGNQLRVHVLHLLNAASDKHRHLLTLVDVWFSVERLCIWKHTETFSVQVTCITVESMSLTHACIL